MTLLTGTDYAPWLFGSALNVGAGFILVLTYNAVRSALPADGPTVTKIVIGILFGAATLASMYFPIRTASGFSVDARSIFILVGSLYGGPVAALIAGPVAIAYRLWLGGPGALGGAVSVVVTAILGTVIARRYGRRIAELRGHEFFLIGVANSVLISVAAEGTLLLQGNPDIPVGALVGAFTVFPLGVMLLGSVMSTTHHRIWWRTQRRLDDIVETVSDLVWETDTNERVTFLSERHNAILGVDPKTAIGKTFAEFDSEWVDAATARADAEARAAHRPFSGQLLRFRRADGAVKILSVGGRPAFNERGQFAGYRGTAQDITLQVQMEEDLRRSRDDLARAQKIGHVGSGRVDLVTGRAVWSDEQYRMLGFDPRAGGASLDLYLTRVHPDDRALLLDARASNELGQQTRPIEFRLVLPSGETRWVHREVEIERDDAGRPVTLYTIMMDITESRRLAEELRRNADHLERAQRAAHIGSAEVDLPTGQEYWSDGMFRVCGIAPDPANANHASFLAAVHPDDRPLLRALRERNNAGQATEPVDYRIVRPSGEVRWIRREAEIGIDVSGEPARLVSVHRDITESRRLEEELHRSADHLLRAQRAARMGSVEVNLSTGQEYWSEGMYRVCGVEVDPVNAKYENFLKTLHPDDRPRLRASREKNDRGETTEPLDYRIVRPNGAVRWMRREVEIAFDAAGRPARRISIHRDVTESRRLEAELRRSADHLQRAQRTARIGSIESDLVTGEVRWSEEMFRICGIDPDPARAGFETFLKAVHPDDRPMLRELRAKNDMGQASEATDYRMIAPGGEILWFRRQAEIATDAAGRPERLIVTHQDITDRKLVVEELRRSRDANARSVRTLRMLGDCNQLLIQATDESQLIKDLCRTICEVGDYAMAWVGYAQDDEAKSVKPVASWGKIGQANVEALVNGAQITWDETQERGRGPIGRALRSGRIEFERDVESSPTYGPWRERVRVHGIRSTLTIPLMDGDRVFGAIGIYATTPDAFDAAETELLAELGSDLNYGIHALRDRAARDKAERELSETRDALRVIMDHTVDGLVTIDEKGTVLTFSRPAQAIFGYAAEEVIGRNVNMLIPPPDQALHDGFIARYLASGRSRIIGVGREVTGRRKDGSTFPMDLQIGAIPGGPGGHRFVGTLRDITVRKQTEEHLQQSQKMEAMGQLTGGVAHDFNNLLAVILGRLQLLDEELEGSPRLQNWARSCIKAVDRGATLTRSLLAFSRQQALEPVELDLNTVVSDMEELVQRTLGEAFEFRAFKGEGLWRVEADPGQLQNALLNLVLNARDAMPKGGSVVVSTANTMLDADYAGSHRDVRPGDYVLLSVSDTGIGMSREVVERAFEPFYTTKEVGKGSGLGLSMVYGFVKQTGGHVSIYSEPGRGTTVRIYLPRKIDARRAGQPALVPSDRALAGTETILIVEDNDDLRDLTRLQLERYGYKVLEASHGAEGLRALASNPHVDLLISDVVLPHGMTGPDLADQAVALWPDLKVIFVSGYNEEHDALERTRARQPVRLLQKPFHAEELAALVRAALD